MLKKIRRFWMLAFLLLAALAVYTTSSRASLPPGTMADRVVVYKAERKLVLFKGKAVLREYRVALGFQPVGAKKMEGDGKTPEGKYTIDYRNPASQFHLSLHVSYPTPAQVAAARKQGISPGGMVMIHGLPNGTSLAGRFHWLTDWTNGCVAVSNEEIEEIWRLVPDGTPIEIRA